MLWERESNMKNLLIAVGLIILLGGCSGTLFGDQGPAIKVEEVRVFHPAPPKQVQMLEVEWAVLNLERIKEIVKKSTESGDDRIVLFALTDKGYQNLSLNIQELKRYIQELQEQLKYYREVLPKTKLPSDKPQE